MSGALPRAAVVLSGNELLDGRIRDTNGAYLSADLSLRGVKVTSVLTVADDKEHLTSALEYSLAAEPDLLVVGGGLGTTHDDLTAACLARALGVGLDEDPAALAMLEERVRWVAERRHLDFEEVFPLARRQALLPVGSTPVPPAGLAPGIAARRGPTRIYAYPGVPYEFEAMWLSTAERLQAEGFFPDVAVRIVRIFGVGELQVAPLLETTPHDLLETGINVGRGEVTVRLRYRRGAPADAQAAAVVAALEAGAPVFSSDGRTVDDVVADGLRERGLTLAVAESCSGGLLGARLTERSGSSDYFVGGVISYANEVKMGLLDVPAGMLAQYGAVSEEVAGAMAAGARAATGSDYALAVSGVAGPDGGTPDKPVGLVYVACGGPRRTKVVRGLYPGDRASVRDYSVSTALHLLRRELAG
ncbi:MAG: nicotinamide-nucleotide amidohydrolase family protein [Actinobacteria bacterium]|nr:nicotinamide-nucleotide amidohydrolase family protein [Actinomycetota bacterium]